MNGTTIRYIYSGQNLIEERDGSGTVLAKYIYEGGIDRPVKVIKGANAYFLQQDALGNVVALVNASGQIAEHYTYDIFGAPTIKDGSGNALSAAFTPFLFTGREWDSETGVYHYRARAYSPALGRLLQADPIDFDGGDPNIYRYCRNNPINWIDPSGLEPNYGGQGQNFVSNVTMPGMTYSYSSPILSGVQGFGTQMGSRSLSLVGATLQLTVVLTSDAFANLTGALDSLNQLVPDNLFNAASDSAKACKLNAMSDLADLGDYTLQYGSQNAGTAYRNAAAQRRLYNSLINGAFGD